jgi:hypothetical protein
MIDARGIRESLQTALLLRVEKQGTFGQRAIAQLLDKEYDASSIKGGVECAA